MEKKLLYGALFLFKFKMLRKTQLRFQILVACRETGSLTEQVKQKENLCHHNIQLKNLNRHRRSSRNFLLLTLDLCLPTVHKHVLSGRAFYTTCDVTNLDR